MGTNMDTKKLIIFSLVAIVVLNVINNELKKGFEKSVIEVIKKNPDLTVAQAPAPEQPSAPPSEEDEIKKALADKVTVNIGDTPVRGKKDAPIQIIVFSDFQCPFSKRGADTVAALEQKYGGKLMFVYKHLPLPFHPEAMPAAKATLAAARQGKYYEYHDKLFENQAQLSEALYVQIAKDLGLNLDKFNSDRNSKEIEDIVQADIAQANSLGFNGTPGFALNGVKILGAYPQEHFEKIIQALGLG